MRAKGAKWDREVTRRLCRNFTTVEAYRGLPETTLKTKRPLTGLWCNGNTSGFGSDFPGSNPGSPTIVRTFSKCATPCAVLLCLYV